MRAHTHDTTHTHTQILSEKAIPACGSKKKKFFTFGLGEQRLCAYLPTLPTEDTESQLDLTARRKTASEVERMMHWYPCPEMLTSESQLQLTAFPHEGGLL